MIDLDTKQQLTFNSGTKVIIKTSLEICGSNTELPIQIIGDFKDIPHSEHEIYLQLLNYQYNKDITVNQLKI